MFDKSIEIWERLVYKEGQNELLNYLVIAYEKKNIVLTSLGDTKNADKYLEKAERIKKGAEK
jgi:hypothetical protein